jgi:O-acetyl-ADP-ribose deacetylase (regulator of RNase III)
MDPLTGGKPVPQTRIFISYKTGADNSLTATANNIRRLLEDAGYFAWMDTTQMVAGEDWNEQIYNAIAKSDLVLLLLAPATGDSEWVRREVDTARGAQVYVLPVRIQGSYDDLRPVLEKFDLPRRQYLDYSQATDEQANKLLASIEENCYKTHERQMAWLAALRDEEKINLFKEAFTPTSKTHAVYTPDSRHVDCKIYLAAGDMTLMRGIDVLVNSENNFMQMARVFETASLSSKLRLYGSYLTRSGYMHHDTVQQELFDQISSGEYPLPINLGYVVPTSAGHPQSSLVKRGARYIFHVSSVRVSHTSRQNVIVPLDNDGIVSAVQNCLYKVLEVDEAQGVISPPGTERHTKESAAVDSYRPIESIILPLLATGGGRLAYQVQGVAETMLAALADFLTNNEDAAQLKLKAVHLCAYSLLDVEAVKRAITAVFG